MLYGSEIKKGLAFPLSVLNLILNELIVLIKQLLDLFFQFTPIDVDEECKLPVLKIHVHFAGLTF